MTTLKYTIIKTRQQYNEYCNILEKLLDRDDKSTRDEIELLTLLIEKWDEEHSSTHEKDPVKLLQFLMQEHSLKAQDLVNILELSKGTISKILNYHKGLSKDTIRKLSDYFKISQEAFNRPYKLKHEVNRRFRNANLMNTRKSMAEAR